MNVGQTNLRTPYSQQFRQYLGDKIHYKSLVWIFFLVNMLNYVERSVIPGSVMEIKEFVEKTVGHDPDTYVGMLQSSFILGFSIASVIFGFFVSMSSPFSVICIGLGVWVLAAFLSGCAWNYTSLFVARLFSGVGEAAFQIVVPAFIDDYSPKNLVGTSMSILYMAIPVGTALGYTLSGYVAEHYSWRTMYIVTGPIMIPFMIILLFYPIDSIAETEADSSHSLLIKEETDNSVEGKSEQDNFMTMGDVIASSCPEQGEERERENDSSSDPKEGEEAKDSAQLANTSSSSSSSSSTHSDPSSGKTSNAEVLRGMGTMITTPTFILAVIGEAACVFISSGFTSFGNVFLMELHMFTTESISALVVGCTGCLAGIIGATMGGYTLDWLLRLRDSYTMLYNYYSHLFIFSVIAVSFCLLCSISLANRYLFIAFFFLGCTAIFAANPSWTLVILHTSPPHIRSLAVGIATIMYHILGDVPAPILIGKLIDTSVEKAGTDPQKLFEAYKWTLQLTLSLSIAIVAAWGVGYLLIYYSDEYGPSKKNDKKNDKKNKKSKKNKRRNKKRLQQGGDDSDNDDASDSGADGDLSTSNDREGRKGDYVSRSLLEDDREIMAVASGESLITVTSSIVIIDSDDDHEESPVYSPCSIPADLATEIVEIPPSM